MLEEEESDALKPLAFPFSVDLKRMFFFPYFNPPPRPLTKDHLWMTSWVFFPLKSQHDATYRERERANNIGGENPLFHYYFFLRKINKTYFIIFHRRTLFSRAPPPPSPIQSLSAIIIVFFSYFFFILFFFFFKNTPGKFSIFLIKETQWRLFVAAIVNKVFSFFSLLL